MIPETLWGLPGPGRWLDIAAQRTSKERFGTISVPTNVAKIAIDGLESILNKNFERVQVLSLNDLDVPQNSDWLPSLGPYVLSDDAAIGSPRAFAELVTSYSLCMIVDSTEASRATCNDFIAFCNSIKKAFIGLEKKIALVVVTDFAAADLATPNLFDHLWVNVVDALDLALHLRNAAIVGRYVRSNDFQDFLASLADGDLELVELFIEENWDGDTPCFADLLAKRWHRRGTDPTLCEALLPGEQWSHGLMSSPSGGVAALDLPSRREQAEASVWAAQVRVVFPLLERYRIRVLEFALELGKGPFLDRVCESAEVEDPFESEIRDLWLASNRFLSAELLLNWMRRVRNASAHRRPTPWADLLEGEELLRKLTFEVEKRRPKARNES